MLSLFTIWQSFQSLVNTAQNSLFRPQTDFQQAVNDISKELWDNWTSQSEKSQQIRDFLSPFLKSKNLITTPRNTYYATVNYPENYGRYASTRVFTINNECLPCKDVEGGACGNGEWKTDTEIAEEFYKSLVEVQCDLIDEQRWAACLNHLTKMPTLKAPKITQIDGGWKIAPRTVSVLVLDYYTRPIDGTFKYTISPANTDTGAGDEIIYDPTSVKLQWSESVLNYFLWSLAKRYGLFIGNEFLAQFSNEQKRTI